jgi:hypothetical protein
MELNKASKSLKKKRQYHQKKKKRKMSSLLSGPLEAWLEL